MTALEAIIGWAESELPEWQSDAVRRLLVQDVLTDNDRQELLLMLKALHGLLPDGVEGTTPLPLRRGMVSGAPKSRANVVLKSLMNLQSINRIPNGSILPFGHQGLTAIYGENGSGKSGYARVLKRSCRARDTQEQILPNIYSTEVATPAKGTLKISIDGTTDVEIDWEDGQASEEVLTNIAVFDSKCARVIVDEKNEASYLPYGAHVFEALVGLLKWVKIQMEGEKPKLEQLNWPEIPGATKAGLFLASLSNHTTLKQIEDATQWTDVDRDKLDKLTKTLTDVEVNDPVKSAATLRIYKDRIVKLKAYLEKQATGISDERLSNIIELGKSLNEAEKAVAIASQTSLKDEPLLGAGESAWQVLYNAAKDYSTKAAYPGQGFPVIEGECRCVFCMQPLNEDAKERLTRFKSFMEQAAKKKHESAKKAFDIALREITALKEQNSAEYVSTLDELKQSNTVAAEATRIYIKVAEERYEYFIRLTSGGELGELPPFPISPVNDLEVIIGAIEQKAIDLEKAANLSEREKLKAEQIELSARKFLSENAEKIRKYVADADTVSKCNQASQSTDTTAITRKAKQIISEALTPQLKNAIQAELTALGAGHLPLNLKPSGSSGETLHQLELRGARSGRKASLTDVLSEGEQRVVALAGFLAEVGSGQHSCPIVLDDPVSSLDHHYRTKIAGRLVLESQERQVIIFTHDIAFLLDLQEKAGEIGGAHFTAQTVSKFNETTGVPNIGLPWHAMQVKDRLQYLRDSLNAIKDLLGTDAPKYNKEAAFLFGMLRETWEAAIEEVVFNKTIIRHGSEVQTLRLKHVGLTTAQYKVIDLGMSKCSMWMIGHDKSKALDVQRPEPKEILAEIETLNSFVRECRKSGELLKDEREAAISPLGTPVG